jgi:hypothetical protein
VIGRGGRLARHGGQGEQVVVLLEHLPRERDQPGLQPRLHVQFGQDLRDVRFGRPLGDPQRRRDLPVRSAHREQPEHL